MLHVYKSQEERKIDEGRREAEPEKHTPRPFYSHEEKQMFLMSYFPLLEGLRCGGIISGCSQGSSWGV